MSFGCHWLAPYPCGAPGFEWAPVAVVARWYERCYWDAIGMPSGCHWDVIGMSLGSGGRFWDSIGILSSCPLDVIGWRPTPADGQESNGRLWLSLLAGIISVVAVSGILATPPASPPPGSAGPPTQANWALPPSSRHPCQGNVPSPLWGALCPSRLPPEPEQLPFCLSRCSLAVTSFEQATPAMRQGLSAGWSASPCPNPCPTPPRPGGSCLSAPPPRCAAPCAGLSKARQPPPRAAPLTPTLPGTCYWDAWDATEMLLGRTRGGSGIT